MPFTKPQHRKEHSCKCGICKSMCFNSPCFPTPEEVEKLVAAGHRDKLALTLYVDPANYFPQYDVMDAYQVVAPLATRTGCIFLDDKGLCTLHDSNLKPLEGRLASHDQPDNGLRVWVCEKWHSEKGADVIKSFQEESK